MRSTKKRVKELRKEVQEALGCTEKQAREHIAKASDFYRRTLKQKGFDSVILSAYRGNSWSISGFCPNKGAEYISLYVNTAQWMDEPRACVEKFVDVGI